MAFGDLTKIACLIRKHALMAITEAGSGHPGGSLSMAEILAVLLWDVMRIDPKNPRWEERDRLVLSKGHACPALYAALALRGFFPVELLRSLRKPGSPLQGHPHYMSPPGIESSTGSLGQGTSQALGMALAARVLGLDYRVFCILGDGEMQEGQVWEAIAAAGHYRVQNLIFILDHNGLQIEGEVERILSIEPVLRRVEAFGWLTARVDGHDPDALREVLGWAARGHGKPVFIEAKTVKGKGVSFMEGKASWHGKAPSRDELQRALEELPC